MVYPTPNQSFRPAVTPEAFSMSCALSPPCAAPSTPVTDTVKPLDSSKVNSEPQDSHCRKLFFVVAWRHDQAKITRLGCMISHKYKEHQGTFLKAGPPQQKNWVSLELRVHTYSCRAMGGACIFMRRGPPSHGACIFMKGHGWCMHIHEGAHMVHAYS